MRVMNKPAMIHGNSHFNLYVWYDFHLQINAFNSRLHASYNEQFKSIYLSR